MPYTPLREPPDWRDRLLAHPMENAVACLAILFSVLVGISLFFDEFVPSESIDHFPIWLAAIFVLMIGAGGLLVLFGLNRRSKERENLVKRWATEKLGWSFTAAGLSFYGLSVLAVFPASLLAWSVPLILAAGAILRWRALSHIERDTRQLVAEVKPPKGE